jgi:archaellin
MELKGSVIATAGNTGSNGTVNTITLHVSNAAAGEAIDLSVGNTIIKYSDTNQVLNLDTSGEFTTTGIGSHDGDIRLEEGEIFEIQIPNMVALLDPDLGTDQTFTLEVIPPNGAVLFIQRSTPISMPAVTSLD